MLFRCMARLVLPPITMGDAQDVIRNFGGTHVRGGEVIATVDLTSGTDDSITLEMPTSVFVHHQLRSLATSHSQAEPFALALEVALKGMAADTSVISLPSFGTAGILSVSAKSLAALVTSCQGPEAMLGDEVMNAYMQSLALNSKVPLLSPLESVDTIINRRLFNWIRHCFSNHVFTMCHTR
jgi:hypothetical protein